MSTVFWVGRSKNAAALRAAFDAWNEGIQDPESVAGNLNARFIDCPEPWEARLSYILY